jgi:xanthine dehydrogenase/oxidase
LSYRTTALPEDGVITEIVIPLPSRENIEITKAYKQAKRKDDDIAIVTSGFRVKLDGDGVVQDAAFAVGGMAPTTVMADKAQQGVMGKKWSDMKTLDAAIDALLEQFQLPFGVPGGMAHYRKGQFIPISIQLMSLTVLQFSRSPYSSASGTKWFTI